MSASEALAYYRELHEAYRRGALPPCGLRGAVVGEKDCAACGGKVRLKVFACREHSEGVTYQECRRCMKWALREGDER